MSQALHLKSGALQREGGKDYRMDNAKDNALPAGSLLGALAAVTCRPRGRQQSAGFALPLLHVNGRRMLGGILPGGSSGRKLLVAGGNQRIESHSSEAKGLSGPLELCGVALCGRTQERAS